MNSEIQIGSPSIINRIYKPVIDSTKPSQKRFQNLVRGDREPLRTAIRIADAYFRILPQTVIMYNYRGFDFYAQIV